MFKRTYALSTHIENQFSACNTMTILTLPQWWCDEFLALD